ncbi:hypothetical protein PIB30_009725 [Stylosanthes scabra]|uniref:DNA repair protein RAD4 n=1 Tax=Stylosanthes scabra TaxID=79078 RepID=A0ABU6W572_9FABA|nr:hypothetical protein [Stylosanthes scabra]
MRRRSQRKVQSSVSDNEPRSQENSEGTLAEISREAVGKLLQRANKVGGKRKKMMLEPETEQNGTHILEQILQPKTSEVGHNHRNPVGSTSAEEKCNNISIDQRYLDNKEELDDSDWEEGTISVDDRPVTIEFDVTPDPAVKNQVRRSSARDKDLAELIHKVHLLCLLARGRLIDSACDDPLIQASLLSLLPSHLLQLSNVTKLSSRALHPLISWFHDNFHVRNHTNAEASPHFALASALETREGSPEEKSKKGRATSHVSESSNLPAAENLNDSVIKSQASETQDDNSKPCLSEQSCRSKRKGDLEFEMQLEMALSATAVGSLNSKLESGTNADGANVSSPSKKMKRDTTGESSTPPHVISTALGSTKVGSPLYWAEVYCSEENLTGKWVHVDVVNSVIDGEDKVEAMTAACKTSLRYVVAFAGQGAKDVIRRYCMKWHKIASQRVDSIWWDSVLAPLRDLESGATGGEVPSRTNHGTSTQSNMNDSFVLTRSSLEDIELETRALTEPLPTNQLAYKGHPLYAIERWLTKYQVLHPKGPILGFCKGHHVYPRTCVQTVKTKERWLREGMQVKANELPVKELKPSAKTQKLQDFEADDYECTDSKENIKLYGSWQLEPLNLPHAMNGIVPKNERGQVDVWSEKCLPPGTVHLRFPRAFSVAKRLEIDYAPAMVGFEFKNGRSYPVFDGIVVCAEFKDVLLEAFAEEEQRRQEEEKRRDETEALRRWYQLISSIVTRQRLKNRYNNGLPSEILTEVQHVNDKESNATVSDSNDNNQTPKNQQLNTSENNIDLKASISTHTEEHEHVFLKESQSFDERTSLLTKRCQCGFSVQVEEL